METLTQTPKTYAEAYAQSIADPEAFWGEQAEQLAWYEKPQQVLSTDENGFYRWYKGGKLNTAYLALDYHVENGRADQTALIYDSPVTGTVQKYTYVELRDFVARFAGALQNLGVSKGDTVVIYMPVIPEALVAMLACARLGAIHSVVFGGFAPHELCVRIDDAKPKLVISASCGIEFDKVIPYKPLLDKALNDSTHKPANTIIFQRPQVQAEMQQGRDLDYMEVLQQAEPAGCVPVDATDPLYILYTSGTTGKPKGIVRDNGGHAVALKYSMKAVYDVDPGDVFWAASDVGWAVGHSYLVYGPLLHGCTSILFEGKPVRTPDAGTFWRIIQQHEVKVLFTAPTAFRAIKKEDPEGLLKKKYDTPSLKYLFLAGERCDVSTYYWAKNLLQVPVIDHWWQTESGWPMVANMAGLELQPAKPGSAGKPVCGYEVHILNEEGQQLIPNQEGVVAVKLPLPPGCLPTLWEDDERFRKSYLERFPGYYMTGDGGYIDEEGYVYIMGRIDDVINVSGHRLSTGEMEEMVSSHPAVAECAVIGIADDLRGQRPVGLVVLKDGQTIGEQQLEQELVALLREKIGAVAYFKTVALVQRLPKTRSGKILRRILRHIADGTPYAVPSTIDDPAILTEIHDHLKKRRIGNAFINLKTKSNQELHLAMTNYQVSTNEEYQEAYKRSVEDPEGFWSDIADTFTWRKKWDKTLEWNFDEPNVKWFQGGKMNITENCLDRHLKTRGNKLALIWEPNDPKERFMRLTYRELHERVCQFANVLKKNGAKKGDRICIYMPMIPELAIAVLACARIGAIHSVVFAGFSAVAMADRIQDAQCSMVLTSDGLNRGAKQIPVKRVVDEALETCPSVEKVIVVERLGWAVNMVDGRDVWYHEEVKTVGKDCPAEEMDAEDMLFILYTSGSTGKPKGVVHTCGGYMVYAQYSFCNVFQYQESDVYWCTADIGWITGHTYLVYGPLLAGATTLMFEGVPTYPDMGRFWQVCDKFGVTIFYTAPTAIRALMAGDIDNVLSYSLDSLRVLGSVGEPINEEAWHWYHIHVGKEDCPVVDTWWQTETGGIMISTLAGVTAMKPSHAGLPLPGIQPILVDSDGNEIKENGVEGYLCVKFPWPSMIRTTYGDHERARLSYFSTYKGLYFTGDGAKRDENGLYRIIGRVDDVINVSGHRFGTAEIEEAINHNEHVIESAVVGYPHDVKGQGIYAFVILKDKPERDDWLRAEIIETVVEKIGKIAKPDKIQIVSGLPKTRSGKIMRRILRKVAEGDTSNLGDTSTLLDPTVVDEIKEGAL